REEAVMAEKLDIAKWEAQANFVFRGKVRKLKAATVGHFPVTDRTVIVKVEEVLRATETLRHYMGAEITVQLSKHEQVRAGEEATFYTQSVMVGESLVVQPLAHIPASSAHGASA